jgi:hypothetical protein
MKCHSYHAGVITISAMAIIFAVSSSQHQFADGKAFLPSNFAKAPIVISGNNVYIVWWINDTRNDEVMFRASTDGGASFTGKINLSNSTNSDSQDAKIAANGGNLIISWWERNQTAEEPVARTSIDNGQSFGPLLRLAANGTIGGAGT